MKCKFKSIAVNVSLQKKGNSFEVSTNVETKNFFLNHWRLAKEDVVFSNSTFKGVWKVSPQSIELDSTSVIQLQKILGTSLFVLQQYTAGGFFFQHCHARNCF